MQNDTNNVIPFVDIHTASKRTNKQQKKTQTKTIRPLNTTQYIVGLQKKKNGRQGTPQTQRNVCVWGKGMGLEMVENLELFLTFIFSFLKGRIYNYITLFYVAKYVRHKI